MTIRNQYADLIEIYRSFDAKAAGSQDRLRLAREYEKTLFVPDESVKAEQMAHLGRLIEEAETLPSPNPVFSILKTHFSDFLHARKSALLGIFESPAGLVGSISGFMDFMGRKDSRSSEERYEVLEARLGKVDEQWSGIEKLLPGLKPAEVRKLRDALELLAKVSPVHGAQVERQYPGLSDTACFHLRHVIEETGAKAASWAKQIAAGLQNGQYGTAVDSTPAAPGSLGPRYAEILDRELGVSLNDMLSWYDTEVQKTRAEMIEAAGKLNLAGRKTPRTPSEVLAAIKEFAGPCDDAGEMFRRLRSYVARAQEGARRYVNIPEESCNVVPAPQHVRWRTYPWSGCSQGCPRRRPLVGEMFSNDRYYYLINDVWFKMLAVHECYPGHHVQWVRYTLDPIPETIKIGAKFVPILEGTAHRSELLMQEFFPEDPFCSLLAAYRRHQTAVRLKADIYRHHLGKPAEECANLYVQELDFDKGAAQGQVKAQEARPGYFTCYYYGYRRLRTLEDMYNIDFKTFTEYLFSAQHISLGNFEEFLKLNVQEKALYLTAFPSKL